MTDRPNRPILESEAALRRYLYEQRLTRRQMLDRIAKVGAAAALGPVLAACGISGGGGTATSGPSAAAPSAAAPSAGGSAAAVPTPESELIVYNWLDYIGPDAIPSFEEKYPVKVQYELFDDIEVAYANLGDDGNGYDLSFPTSVDIPRFREAGTISKLDKSLIPNLVNLGPEWANPGYDPNNDYSMPYLWWTTGIGYDTTKVADVPTSSTALWDERYAGHISMMDDYQETFGLALIQLGYSANTTSTAELDEALELLRRQKPMLRTYTNDTVTTMIQGDVWIGMIWGPDIYQIQAENPNVAFSLPQEGGIRGSDTMVVYSGAKHPIAAQLFINHMLDAQVSADNTNAIGYMGPNEAAKELIDETILADPNVNPTKAVLENLEELLDMPNEVDEEYLSRWQALKAG